MLQEVEKEVGASVRDAYAEGYKAGRVEAVGIWKPLIEAERERSARAEQARQRAEQRVWYGILGGFAAGLVGSLTVVWAMGR